MIIDGVQIATTTAAFVKMDCGCCEILECQPGDYVVNDFTQCPNSCGEVQIEGVRETEIVPTVHIN